MRQSTSRPGPKVAPVLTPRAIAQLASIARSAPSWRRIGGIKWMKEVPAPAFTHGSTRHMSAAQKAGLRFERAMTKALPGWRSRTWFQFSDQNGVGWASPDLFLVQDDCVILIECKLTDTPAAIPQLTFYRKLLTWHFKRRSLAVVAAKNVTQASANVVPSLSEALALAHRGVTYPVWHAPWPERLGQKHVNLHSVLGPGRPIKELVHAP